MADSKEFNLTDYLLLANPFYGDAIWAAKRKLMGQNDYNQAFDYALQGDSSAAARLAPLAASASLMTQGYRLPGMKPGSTFKKFTSALIGRTGNAILGRHLKPAFLSIPAAALIQSLVSGQRTKSVMQDKTASSLSKNDDEEVRRRMARANVAASVGAGMIPQLGGHVYLNKLVPSLYKYADNPLNQKQQKIFDRFIQSKNFHVGDFADDAVAYSTRKRNFGGLSPFLPYLFSGPSYIPNDDGIFSKILKRIGIAPIAHSKDPNKYFKKTKGFVNLNEKFFRDMGESGSKLKPGVLAHEVGHGLGPSAYVKGLARPISALLPTLNLGQVLLAKDEDTGRMGAMLAPLSGAPLLASEIDASVRGSKLLSKLTKGKLSTMQKLSPFMGLPTYAAFTAAPALAHMIKKTMGGYADK